MRFGRTEQLLINKVGQWDTENFGKEPIAQLFYSGKGIIIANFLSMIIIIVTIIIVSEIYLILTKKSPRYRFN